MFHTPLTSLCDYYRVDPDPDCARTFRTVTIIARFNSQAKTLPLVPHVWTDLVRLTPSRTDQFSGRSTSPRRTELPTRFDLTHQRIQLLLGDGLYCHLRLLSCNLTRRLSCTRARVCCTRGKHCQEVFHRLPLPYVEEEYEIGSIVNDVLENITEPAPYIHIKRNVYLVKRKRDGADTNVGCTNCNANSDCSENCECRGLSLSCTKACHCSEMCTNRPFRKEKKIKVVKTDWCGWGAIALESIEKGRFVVEYVGEVIDDALCEQRLWDMKRRGDQNFYMCEIRKDFTIDATFKGNFSRFLNHSCDPNCGRLTLPTLGLCNLALWFNVTVELQPVEVFLGAERRQASQTFQTPSGAAKG
ncbi:Histone-lysine N-methyltransferase ASHR3 [Dendrobium catenatum]|uniref:Histone-lysine N-methyltransferase ASHR3 n=1 Tax=Dendrobium catenatum TaxID=906689 RepID=A0A2I0W8P9_9ASPA|nr:Histone-lysine N-methyltransferase ASHR3 [Dendrobium catenatum]